MARKTKTFKSAGAKPGRQKSFLPERNFSRLCALSDRTVGFLSLYKNICEILAVIFLIAVGFFFRVEVVSDWKKAENRTFFEGQPLHTTFDAYYYLSLAQDIVDTTYNKVDEKRGVPDNPPLPRPMPPPLISVIAAQISKISGWGLGWIGAVLPAVFGGLLALPLYLLGRYYSGAVAGFSGAFLALLYPFYIYRSGFGRFDTDCLNVTFVVTSAYLFMRFAVVTNWKRYIYAGIALINYGIFLWWWDQAPAAVTALTFFPFAVALIFYYRPAKKEACMFFGIIGLGCLLVAAIKGPGIFIDMLKAIFEQYWYISKEANGKFPNIGETIQEQLIPPVSATIALTTGSLTGFIFALCGIGFLLYKRFKISLFLGSIIILSFFAFTKAARFIIFLVPLLGIGSGYLLGELWKLKNRFLPLFVVCPLLFLYLSVPLYIQNTSNAPGPKLMSVSAAGMDTALHTTPPDAVIWAWWDNGHALTYFARRATINDGAIHSGERTYYASLPLALTDFRLAANFMHFYVTRGSWGVNHFCGAAGLSTNEGMDLIKKILAAGPEGARPLIEQTKLWSWCFTTTSDWITFFFPPENRPVYLFLDELMARVDLWYWFGTWNPDTKTGEHPLYSIYEDLQINDTTISENKGNRGIIIDINSGEMQTEGQTFQLAGLSIRTKKDFKVKKYTASSTYYFEMNEPLGYGALMDKRLADTVFNRLYVRLQPDDTYFSMVKNFGMACQLWEVKGEAYKGNGGADTAAVK